MIAQSIRPPGPKSRPLIGLFPEFRSDPAGFLLSVAREHGDLAYLKLGHQHLYLLNRPDFVQDVLITHASSFMKSRMMQRAKVLIGDGLLTTEGQFHLRQRRLVQPAFHRQRIADYATAMTECALRSQSRWAAGEVRDMAEEMMRLTLAIVGRTLFSADVESEAADIGQAMTDVLGLFDTMLLPFSEYLQKLPLPSTRRFERAKEKLDRTIYGFIRERRASGVDKGDLLSMLLLAVDEQGDGGGMTDTQVHDEAMTLFLAGHETTANALTWTWYLLSQHPDVEARFHAEIDNVLEGRAPTFDDIPRLEYAERVFAESMRLYPPAWAVSRLVLKDYQADQYQIPAKSVCIVSPYVMHRSPKYFPDPERFDPERWTPAARESRPKYSYFPFGAGPRICIGERFAWTEGVLVLATIGQRWRMRLDPKQKVAHLAQITLRTRYGMRMSLEPRVRG